MSAAREEKLMRGDFPEYDAYARRTPRFIPGIW
jgi:protein-S-isoprenylcysteine O-methyltransferase Ste14